MRIERWTAMSHELRIDGFRAWCICGWNIYIDRMTCPEITDAYRAHLPAAPLKVCPACGYLVPNLSKHLDTSHPDEVIKI